MKVVSINREKKTVDTKELADVLLKKWTRRDKERAAKKYGNTKQATK